MASGLVDMNLPRWADIKDEVTIISGVIISLWFLSGVLSLVDHLRFDGWTDDGPKGAVQFASSFCNAVIQGNDDKAAEMAAPFLTKNTLEFKSRLQSIRSQLGGAQTQVTSDDLDTVDHVLFRDLVPNLGQLDLAPTDVVAFVPVVEELNVSVGSPIKIVELSIALPFGKFEVIDFNVVEISRPPILR